MYDVQRLTLMLWFCFHHYYLEVAVFRCIEPDAPHHALAVEEASNRGGAGGVTVSPLSTSQRSALDALLLHFSETEPAPRRGKGRPPAAHIAAMRGSMDAVRSFCADVLTTDAQRTWVKRWVKAHRKAARGSAREIARRVPPSSDEAAASGGAEVRAVRPPPLVRQRSSMRRAADAAAAADGEGARAFAALVPPNVARQLSSEAVALLADMY